MRNAWLMAGLLAGGLTGCMGGVEAEAERASALAALETGEAPPEASARGLPPQAVEALSQRGAVVLPREMPVLGRSITDWSQAWFEWTFSVPPAGNPALVLEADCAAGQDTDVFFVPIFDFALTYQRTCQVPARTPVLVPVWAVINDYPCPDPAFQPAPGQSLEDFLQEGARAFNDQMQGVVVTVDGQPVDHTRHRHTTDLFTLDAEDSLVGHMPDACLLGTPQPAVTDGWFLMLLLAPGEHVVHVKATSPFGALDYTYVLDVQG